MRKACDHPPECDCRSLFPRDCSCKRHPLPSYVLQNLGGNITRTRQRLERLTRARENPRAVIKNGRRGWYVKCPACELPYMEGLTYDGAQQLADAHNAEHHPPGG